MYSSTGILFQDLRNYKRKLTSSPKAFELTGVSPSVFSAFQSFATIVVLGVLARMLLLPLLLLLASLLLILFLLFLLLLLLLFFLLLLLLLIVFFAVTRARFYGLDGPQRRGRGVERKNTSNISSSSDS